MTGTVSGQPVYQTVFHPSLARPLPANRMGRLPSSCRGSADELARRDIRTSSCFAFTVMQSTADLIVSLLSNAVEGRMIGSLLIHLMQLAAVRAGTYQRPGTLVPLRDCN